MKYQSLSYYLQKSEKLNSHQLDKAKKIAILGNYTLDGLGDVLKVFCSENNLNIQVHQSSYNQYRQEIINTNSEWNKFKAHLTFIILDFDSLIGDTKFNFYSLSEKKREKTINQICNEIKELFSMALTKQNGKLVVSNFIPPTFSPLGIYDAKTRFSLKDFVNSLNESIKQLAMKNDSLYILEMDAFFQKYGRLNLTNEKMRFLADMKISPSFLPALADHLMCFIKPLFGNIRKCLVLDLDNSLWGGIIGEDGLDGIKLDNKPPGNAYLEFQKVILELYNRGIILTINSKNNLEDVKEVFKKHPFMVLKEHHFSSMYINWDDKASNLQSIAKDLNIGIDSLVFWDDDPVNRELVTQRLPEVLVVDVPNDPSLYANTLRNLNDFNSFQITAEDRKKGQMYASQLHRKSSEKKFSNIDDFLASLNMEVTIKNPDNFTIPRISQLTMKTNQFNLTTKRYSEEDIKKMANTDKYLIRTFSVIDKFGDNGLTGLYIINKENKQRWKIDTFLMSCRIMGRNVEKVMLNDLIENAKRENIQELIGHYYPTKKNPVTKDLYSNFGFSRKSDTDYVLEIPQFEKEQISYIKTSIKK